MSIVIKTAIDINAAPKDVWAVLSDFPAYGEWSNFSSIDGVARAGTRLKMTMPGMSFGSTVTAASPEQRLEWAAWILNKTVFEGRHTFTQTRNPDGSTHLDNTETFSGALIFPFEGLFNQKEGARANGYDGFNQALKTRVEAKVVGGSKTDPRSSHRTHNGFQRRSSRMSGEHREDLLAAEVPGSKL